MFKMYVPDIEADSFDYKSLLLVYNEDTHKKISQDYNYHLPLLFYTKASEYNSHALTRRSLVQKINTVKFTYVRVVALKALIIDTHISGMLL